MKATRLIAVIVVPCITLLSGGMGTSRAQTSASQSASAGSTKIQYQKLTYNRTGGSMEGTPVVFENPQVDIRAQQVNWKGPLAEVQEVRAQRDVVIKANIAAAGAQKPARVEATSDVATYDHAGRKLTLRGKVNGWYETAKTGRSKLNTDMAVLYLRNDDLMVDLTGGVQINVPAEATQSATKIGAVTITSRDASIDEGKGVARFIGNARALSDDTDNKIDISAPEFIVTRSAAGTIDTIRTSGRTLIKANLPPDPEANETPAATVTTGSTPDGAGSTQTAMARPTYVEASADSATVTRATSTLVLSGNVKGFYEMAPPGKEKQRFDFVGDRINITYVLPDAATDERPSGLNVEAIGPGTLNLPAFLTEDLKKK